MVDVQPADETPETWYSALTGSLYVMRVPLAMAALTVFALTVPEQVQEVYRVLAQGTAEAFWNTQLLIALGSLIALSVVLWQVARELSYDFPGRGEGMHALARLLLKWGPRLIAATPFLGAAAGIWFCQAYDINGDNPLVDPFVRSVKRLNRDFYFGIGLCLLLAAAIFLVAVLFERRLAPAGSNKARRVAKLGNWLLFPIVALGSVAIFATEQVQIPQLFGAVPIFALWMVLLALVTAWLSGFRLLAVPVLAIIAILVLAIEVLGLSDNHAIRITNKTLQLERPTVQFAFDQWLQSRADRKAYEDAKKPYPIYVIAAEGGGLYAAYQTAKFLAMMQDRCPSFAQHIFAISGVSGGSLGAAVFAGMAAEQAKNAPPQPCLTNPPDTGPLEARARRMLSKDLLSPVLWSALFPDFLQRLVPWPFPALDRALGLETAFEKAWEGTAPGNPLASSFYDLCGRDARKCLRGATPMLALNVTNVDSGMQMVLSPLDFNGVGPESGTRKIYDFFSLFDPFDLRLSTAVGLSARFPWLSPPGWYRYDPAPTKDGPAASSKPRRMRFVDGGYVDNSGVLTALGLAQYIDTVALPKEKRPNVEIRVLLISALWAPFDKMWSYPPQDYNQGELMPPLGASITSREGRGFTTQFDAALEEKDGLRVTEVGFYYGYIVLPLGWQLSEVSRQYIEMFKGKPERCPINDEKAYQDYVLRSMLTHEQAAVAYIKRADCVVARITNELTPTAPIIKLPSINSAH